MTLTATKRTRSPKAYQRKDARNAIYAALYGRGSRDNNWPPAYDPSRKHTNPEKVDWIDVKATLLRCWLHACFDEITANKLVSDFNFYSKMNLGRRELES